MNDRTINRRGMFGRLAAVPLAVGVAASAQGGQKRGAPAAAPPAGKRTFAPPLSGRETVRRRYFPDVELVTSEGDKVRFYDDLIKDKIVILNLMYAKCDGVCPITTSNLKAVRKILSRDVDHDIFIYSMTMDSALIIGEPRPVTTGSIPALVEQLPKFKVRLARDGQLVEEGSGRNSLRSPALCVAELVSAMAKQDGAEPLSVGDLVSSGTLTESTPIQPGATWSASVEGIDLPTFSLTLV